ncbi:hypothetical protein OB955_08690 [Halobacteria archaeon AArc-m2/3/4]|uniref:Uncharacterized protein n=1 Tax=Natronoglomus mannanivorans TaxID=2979990 RepID=A0ABT2QD46_9EURY|nr:hypothetical protein [Halobacteria archaeon AArc-m2/3/4]
MNREQLLDRVTEDIFAHVMQGTFPEHELARSIKPEQMDERFEEYELLLDLHFILKADVIDFVRELPKRLRNVRTETQTTSRTRRGTVDGRINWGETIKKRYSEHPRDASIFVCDNRSENYDIPENLVLKRLIAVVHTTIREAEEYLRGDYEWVSQTWKGNENLIDELQRIVERNVHVRRIRDPDTYEPTERMLTTAADSRHEIYRDAASLLRTRQRLFSGESDAIRDLLEETAIAPDTDSLFELFVLFRFVATLEELRESQPQFKTIATDRQEVARFEGETETEIVLYHDNSARDRKLSFVAVPDEEKDEFSRTEQVQLTAKKISSDYFETDFRDHTGRPDVIVLEIISEADDHHEREYLITEVKNSANEKTIRQGVKETLEYLAFLQVDDEFVFGVDDEDYFGTGYNGLLVVQDLDRDTAAPADQSDNEITILQAAELEAELEGILRNVL